MDTALPPTPDACRDRMRALLDEARALSAEIERVAEKQIAESELADRLPAVIDQVCAHWSVTRAQLMARCRLKTLVEARFVCWLLLFEDPKVNLSMIGRAFSGRDQGSIAYGIRQASHWAATDRKLSEKITACRAGLQAFTAEDLVAR